MAERVVNVDGVSIWTETFGDGAGIPMLLIMGASVQSIFWPDELIERLVQAGRFVIRFDNRDTGRSTCFDFAEHPYTLDDMALDAVGVLDAYGVEAAHVAGLSMGGMITQVMMIKHQQRLKSAALIMTSPLSGGGSDTGQAGGESDVTLLAAEDLPGPDQAWVARATEWQTRIATTRGEKIQKRVDSLAMMLGPDEPFDEQTKRALATREYDRALNYDAQDNHPLAIAMSKPSDRRRLLAKVDVPTLVIHGTEDPILPYPHGVSLADTIPGAKFYSLDGVGHNLAERCLAEVANQLIELQDR